MERLRGATADSCTRRRLHLRTTLCACSGAPWRPLRAISPRITRRAPGLNRVAGSLPKSPTNALCELRHLGGCGGPLEGAHVINKSALRNVRGALAYCEKNSEILIASICHNHNTAPILKVRVSDFGVEYVSGVLEGLRLLSKSRPPEWRLSALLASPSPSSAPLAPR